MGKKARYADGKRFVSGLADNCQRARWPSSASSLTIVSEPADNCRRASDKSLAVVDDGWSLLASRWRAMMGVHRTFI